MVENSSVILVSLGYLNSLMESQESVNAMYIATSSILVLLDAKHVKFHAYLFTYFVTDFVLRLSSVCC
jgi:hypothetical protein